LATGRFAEPMSRLIDELRKLPGIGSKSAQRLAFHVLRSSDADARALAEAILVLRERLRLCSICNNVTDVDPCVYCASPTRDQRVICVVEEPTNIAAIERTRSYNGVYHVLHGTLSPIGGVGPEQLRIPGLLARLSSNSPAADPVQNAGAWNEDSTAPEALVREVILATSPTTEGEATAAYLAQEIRRAAPELHVTRIATGVPAGSDIEYADEVTMTRSLEGRREF
jgi:recombination protein RecR